MNKSVVQNVLNPARFEGEDFDAYRKRRRTYNKVLKIYLQGRYAHVSREFVGRSTTGTPLFESHTYNIGRKRMKREHKAQKLALKAAA